MSRITWGDPGTRFFEAGVDRGVFYPQEGPGVPWIGLIAIQEAPSGADLYENFYDGIRNRLTRLGESFAAQIEAYTYPPEFEAYDGVVDRLGGQKRKEFGFAYRVQTADDIQGLSRGHKIHLVYNATTIPSDRDYASVSKSTDLTTFSWGVTTRPHRFLDGSFSAHVVIDTRVAHAWAVKALEDILYGTADLDPRLPSPDEVVQLFEDASILRVTDHGDGTWTAEGPDEAFNFGPNGYFEITWPSAIWLDQNTYRLSSL